MNNLEMEAFVKIMECGNFSQAARKLYLPQSTLSTRINSLESELGAKLFERRKGMKKIELTETGKQLAFASKNWYAFIEEVEKIKRRSAEDKIYLNFGSVDTYNTYLFTPLFKKLREYSSKININIRTYNSTELYQEVDSGRLDVAFTLLNIPMEGIEIKKAFEEPRVVIVNGRLKKDAGADGNILNLLCREKEIFFIGDKAFNVWHEQVYNSEQRNIFQVDTDRLLMQFMDKKGYWSIVPLAIGYELARRNGLFLYALNCGVPKRICYKIRRKISTSAGRKSMEIFNKCYDEVSDEILNKLIYYTKTLK